MSRLGIGHTLAEGHDPSTCATCLEPEVSRSCELIVEIIGARDQGNEDSLHGNSDEDLLAAVEDAEGTLRQWREALPVHLGGP